MNGDGSNVSKLAPTFSNFLPEISDRIQTTVDAYLETYNEHHAFSYLVAELYETTDEQFFVFTDGPKDGGIDWFVKDSPSYSICQCKCPSLDGLIQDPGSVPTFDQSAVNELRAAIEMLRDRTGDYEVKSAIKRLRGDYQRDLSADEEATHLTAILAVLGVLTEQARATFAAYRSSFAKDNVHLKLIEWKSIYDALHALRAPEDIDFKMRVNFDSDNDLLAHREYCYVLAHAYDFYEAFKQHGWQLFEWNVRFQLPNSKINKRIIATLSTARGRKNFHHYNNGLLITCKRYRKDLVRKRLTLVGPQIVNGCQTVRAICEAYENLTPENQDDFREAAKVQVKVIRNTDPNFIAELVISTNDQNPMNPRNLKSNTAEQRDIQASFRALPKRWFYERKDGEFPSLLASSSHVKWFRKSDYSVGRRRFRVVDNQEVAKSWYSFTGHSDRALRGGIKYFEDDDVYDRIFKTLPSPAFWSAMAQPGFVPKEEYFHIGSPSAYQYLLACGIARYVHDRRVSFIRSKREAISRGMATGTLQRDPRTGTCISSEREIDDFLSHDSEYFINTMINNMREVLVELFSLVLCSKYVICDALTSQKLTTQMPNEAKFFDKGFDSTLIPTEQEGVVVFGPTYEFLKDCIRQYYFANELEIKAAPRLKSYLAQRSTVNKLRQLVLERNGRIADFDAPWKEVGKAFLESLPDIP